MKYHKQTSMQISRATTLPGMWGNQAQLIIANGTFNSFKLSEEHSGNVP